MTGGMMGDIANSTGLEGWAPISFQEIGIEDRPTTTLAARTTTTLSVVDCEAAGPLGEGGARWRLALADGARVEAQRHLHSLEVQASRDSVLAVVVVLEAWAGAHVGDALHAQALELRVVVRHRAQHPE